MCNAIITLHNINMHCIHTITSDNKGGRSFPYVPEPGKSVQKNMHVYPLVLL